MKVDKIGLWIYLLSNLSNFIQINVVFLFYLKTKKNDNQQEQYQGLDMLIGDDLIGEMNMLDLF